MNIINYLLVSAIITMLCSLLVMGIAVILNSDSFCNFSLKVFGLGLVLIAISLGNAIFIQGKKPRQIVGVIELKDGSSFTNVSELDAFEIRKNGTNYILRVVDIREMKDK